MFQHHFIHNTATSKGIKDQLTCSLKPSMIGSNDLVR